MIQTFSTSELSEDEIDLLDFLDLMPMQIREQLVLAYQMVAHRARDDVMAAHCERMAIALGASETAPIEDHATRGKTALARNMARELDRRKHKRH